MLLTGAQTKERLVPLFPHEVIRARVKALALEIENELAQKNPVVVGILNGAFIFMSDLVRHFHLPYEIDFIGVKSYDGLLSSGQVKITKPLHINVQGRHVLIVEDILDTGLSLDVIWQYFENLNPLSLEACALIDKRPSARARPLVRFTGFRVEGAFVVGYGMDYENRYRSLRDICCLEFAHEQTINGEKNENHE